MRKQFAVLLSVVVLVGGGCFLREQPPARPSGSTSVVTDFRSCVAAGNAVMESYPRQCAAGGKTYVESIGNALAKADLIVASSPRPGDTVSSPITVTGEARGTWYFEASFPVKLLDADGNVLGRTAAQAQGDWMTEEFVPFTATFSYTATTAGSGTLVLEKDNPSGLPENDDQLTIPVQYAATVQSRASYGTAVRLNVGATAMFEDGLFVRLDEVNDSRCPADVVCIWEGELAPVLVVWGGAFGAEQEIWLGTVRTNSVTVAGYTFTLNAATETSATVTVTH